MSALGNLAKRIGFAGAAALFVVYATLCAYVLPSHVKVRVTGTEVNRKDAVQPDGTTRAQDVNYITAEDLDGDPRIFRNVDTGWGWPPYFKFDSGDLLAQAKNLADDDPPPTVLVRYYGFRIRVLSAVPNAVDMRIVPSDYEPLPVFNISFAVLHVLVIGYVAIRVRRWRRASGKPEVPV